MQQIDLPQQDSLTLHMEGLDKDEGDMRIAAFLEKVDALRLALQDLDKHLSGIDKPTLDYVVSGLSHQSPAAVTLTPKRQSVYAGHQADVVPTFMSIMEKAQQGAIRELGLSHDLLDRLLKLAVGCGDKFKTMWLSFGDKAVATISQRTYDTVRELIAKKLYSFGTVKGRVEWYNSHNKEKHFYLYPVLGDRVRCVFGDDLLSQASAAVERTVIVSGTLEYWENDYFPHEVTVGEIEVIDDDPDAALTSMRGVAADATGRDSAGDFVRNRRDGWQ